MRSRRRSRYSIRLVPCSPPIKLGVPWRHSLRRGHGRRGRLQLSGGMGRARGNEQVDGKAIAAGIRQVIARQRALFRDHCVCDPPPSVLVRAERHGHRRRWRARAVVSYEDITERKREELLLGLEFAVACCLAGCALHRLSRRTEDPGKASIALQHSRYGGQAGFRRDNGRAFALPLRCTRGYGRLVCIEPAAFSPRIHQFSPASLHRQAQWVDCDDKAVRKRGSVALSAPGVSAELSPN